MDQGWNTWMDQTSSFVRCSISHITHTLAGEFCSGVPVARPTTYTYIVLTNTAVHITHLGDTHTRTVQAYTVHG